MERAFLKGLGLETLSQTTGFGNGQLLSTASLKKLAARHAEAGLGIMNSFKAKPGRGGGAGESMHAGGLHVKGLQPQGPRVHREPDLGSAECVLGCPGGVVGSMGVATDAGRPTGLPGN